MVAVAVARIEVSPVSKQTENDFFFTAGKSARGAPMLNTQINNTITANVTAQVDVVAGSIVRGRDERLVKRAPAMAGKPGCAMESMSHSHQALCCSESSEQQSGRSELQARSAIAARYLPGPAWGTLVVLKALSS